MDVISCSPSFQDTDAIAIRPCRIGPGFGGLNQSREAIADFDHLAIVPLARFQVLLDESRDRLHVDLLLLCHISLSAFQGRDRFGVGRLLLSRFGLLLSCFSLLLGYFSPLRRLQQQSLAGVERRLRGLFRFGLSGQMSKG
ncbi:MAG: hypothetical protein AAF773_16865 [Cyanobacteria bacterium P01_D01_bin.115]